MGFSWFAAKALKDKRVKAIPRENARPSLSLTDFKVQKPGKRGEGFSTQHLSRPTHPSPSESSELIW